MNLHLQGAMFSLAAFGVYATHDVVIKFLGATYNPFQIMFVSAVMSLPLMFILIGLEKEKKPLIPRHPWWSLLRAICTVLTAAAAFYAFSTLPLAQTYTIIFTMPLIITLLAIPMLGERVGIHRGGAVLVGLIGVLIVLRPGDASSSLSIGHFVALFAAFMGAITALIVRKIGNYEGSGSLMLYPLILSIIVSGTITPFVYQPMTFISFLMMSLVALFGFIASFLLITAYRMASTAIVAPMQYSQILWAVLYGAVFFHETPTIRTIAGALIIIASGIYIVLREGRPKVSNTTPVLENRPRIDVAIITADGERNERN